MVFDTVLVIKDRKIALLRSILGNRQPADQPLEQDETSAQSEMEVLVRQPKARKGKAPPVEMVSGEDPNIRFDNWLPSRHRAAVWNKLSVEEKIIQLAGHLKGRAHQEYNLLGEDQLSTYDLATQALRKHLDPASKVLVRQDFHHTSQQGGELVADFIRRLERVFHAAYG